MCRFTIEDDQLKIISQFVIGMLQTMPLDALRKLYLKLLKSVDAKLESALATYDQQLSSNVDQFTRITTDETYKTWLSSENPALLHLQDSGSPEEATVARSLCSNIYNSGSLRPSIIAYFSFRREHGQGATAIEAWRSMIKQLLLVKPKLMIYIYDSYEEALEDFIENAILTDENVAFGLLRIILCCTEAEGIIFVIDSLQECVTGAPPFLARLFELMTTAEASFRAVTSGSVDISKYFEQSQTCYQICLKDYEIKEEQITQIIEDSLVTIFETQPLLQSFRESLTSHMRQFDCQTVADAKFELQYLKSIHIQTTPSSFRRELAGRPQRSPKAVFQQVMSRTDESLKPWISRLFMWMTFSLCPLRVEQLATALSLLDGEMDMEPSDDHLARDLEADLAHFLGPLVLVEKKLVKFTHPIIAEQARDYVEAVLTKPGDDFSAHRRIAHTCLHYLSTNRIRSIWASLYSLRYEHLDPLAEDFWGEHGFTLYAIQHWLIHCRMIQKPTDDDIIQVAARFDDENWVEEWYDMDLQLERPKFSFLGRSVTSSPLRLAACLGLDVVLKFQATPSKEDIDPELREGLIVLAAQNDDIALLEHLLDIPHANSATVPVEAIAKALSKPDAAILRKLLAKSNLSDGREELRELLGPLARAGKTHLVKQILQPKQDLQPWHTEIEGALRAAVSTRNSNLVDFLLSLGLFQWNDRPDEDPSASSILNHTMIYGDEIVLDIFIKHAPHVNFRVDRSPLQWACVMGDNIKLEQLVRTANTNLNVEDGRGCKPMHYAAFYGRLHVIELLVSKKAEIDPEDKNGETPLCLAVRNQHIKIVQKLLQAGAKHDTINNRKESLLHIAVSTRSLEVARVLVDHGADLGCKNDDGLTPLLLAASKGDASLCRCLLDSRSRIDEEDAAGLTSLHHAARAGDIATITLFLERGANVDQTTQKKKVALHYAAEEGNMFIAQCLMTHGANADIRDECYQTPLEYTADRGFIYTARAILENSNDEVLADGQLLNRLLHSAVKSGSVEMVETMLRYGADVNSRDREGTPLHIAVDFGILEQVRYLLKNDADVTARGPMGATPLYLAVENEEISKALLDSKSEVKALGGVWGTPLNAATNQVYHRTNGAPDIFDLLFEHGALVTDQDEQGRTPFHVAAHCGDIKLMEFFLEKHPSGLRLKDKQHRLPLHHAAAQGNVSMVNFILESSNEDDVVMTRVADRDGWTPLHWACRSDQANRPNVIWTLLERKADPDDQDYKGWKAEHVSIFHGGDIRTRRLFSNWTTDIESPPEDVTTGPDDEVEEEETRPPALQDEPGLDKAVNGDDDQRENDSDHGSRTEKELSMEGLPTREGEASDVSCDGCFCVSSLITGLCRNQN